MQCGPKMMTGDEFTAGYLFLPLLQRHLLHNYGEEDITTPMDPAADYESELSDDGTLAPRIWHILRNGSVAKPGNLVGVRRRYGN
jgi:hypothetical protein